MLSNNAKRTIIKKFPNVGFSYEKILHKKINTDNMIFITIPKGRKYYAWFTKYKHYNRCYLFELDNKKRITDVKIIKTMFNNYLTIGKGTIVYGTMIEANGFPFFNVEDIKYYKGESMNHHNLYNRLHYLNDLFKNTTQKSYSKNMVTFGMPIINQDYNEIKKSINKLPYELYAIQYKHLYNKLVVNEKITIKQDKSREFIVMTSHLPDIYELFTKEGIRKGYAYISSYNKSVYMNNLFRMIKENDDLDLLEESDDEEEFEDMDVNKFIKPNKQILMKCQLNMRFKLWEPMDIIKILN